MKAQPNDPLKALDSFDYCVEFWDGALDAEDEIDHFVRQASPHGPRQAQPVEDVA
jgi:hypothetical protein